MILNSVLRTVVTGPQGEKIGQVADARFELNGGTETFAGTARLHGFIVSPRTASSFMGYERTSVNRPWPLAALLAWRHRGSFLVLWSDVESITDRGIRLRSGFTRYDPALPDT